MRKHLKTCSGEKSNKCKQCDFKNAHSGNLRRHLKTHSGEKSNKCKQCDYASSFTDVLREHLKTHSGEKSNRCKQCDFTSSRSMNLRWCTVVQITQYLQPWIRRCGQVSMADCWIAISKSTSIFSAASSIPCLANFSLTIAKKMV